MSEKATSIRGASADKGRKMLENYPLFSALDESVRKDIAARAQPRSFPAGGSIFRAGSPGQTMMAVVSGTVRISLPGGKGKEVILADLPAGEIFGEIALLDGKGRSADARALTRCDLLVLDRRDFLSFLERSPAACVKVMEMLCARVRRSDERMADIAFFDFPARLAKTLLQYPTSGPAPAMVTLTQTDLADMAGGTREYVNRCLRDWHRRGLLEVKRGGIVILDPEKLRVVAIEGDED